MGRSSASPATLTSAATITFAANAGRVSLKPHLQRGVYFEIKAGNARWACTLIDRATHERMKAIKVKTPSISSDSSSASSTKSL